MKIFYALLIVVFLGSAVIAATDQISSKTKASASTKQVNIYRINEKREQTDNIPIIEIIADYSGSMRKDIDSVRSEMSQIASQLSANSQLGLRIAGIGRNGNCSTSTELVLPVAEHPVNEITTAFYKYNAVAPVEPLTLSLELAINNDLAKYSSTQKKKIIIITDGHETCPGNPCASIKKLVSTRSDIVIDVIFTSSKAPTVLKCLAYETGGKVYKYITVSSALQSAIFSDDNISESKLYKNYQYNYEFIKE